ncbi:MAG: dipicolinate synthase subunit DpsA [Clostridiales bacterium]|nr:dipicolinate synthase subunit DpsA [Clostridiales bacterium]
MKKQYDAAIIGGDKRQVYLTEFLKNEDISVVSYGIPTSFKESCGEMISLEEICKQSRVILAPIPMSRDKKHLTCENNSILIDDFLNLLDSEHTLIGGSLTSETKIHCIKNNIPYFDLMDSHSVTTLNAVATAEGAIAKAISESSGNLDHSKGLILGFGRCGKILAKKLQSFGVHVYICARSKEALTEGYAFGYEILQMDDLATKIKDFEYIFNTIPALVLTDEILDSVSTELTIIDIASAPGGLNYESAKSQKLNAHLYSGIPGKIAPKASAKILADEMIPIIKGGKE